MNQEKYLYAGDEIRSAFRLYLQNRSTTLTNIAKSLPENMPGLKRANVARWLPQNERKESTTKMKIDSKKQFDRLFEIVRLCIEICSEEEIIDANGVSVKSIQPDDLSFIDERTKAFRLRKRDTTNSSERNIFEAANPDAKRYVLFTGSVLTGINLSYLYSTSDSAVSFFNGNEKLMAPGKLVLNTPTKMIIDAEDDHEDVCRVVLKRENSQLNHFYYTGSRVSLSCHLKPEDCLLVLWEKGKPINDILKDFNLSFIKEQ